MPGARGPTLPGNKTGLSAIELNTGTKTDGFRAARKKKTPWCNRGHEPKHIKTRNSRAERSSLRDVQSVSADQEINLGLLTLAQSQVPPQTDSVQKIMLCFRRQGENTLILSISL